jgi:pyruvate/2-oxoglutarate/acetoin dehydrogenase E1 component
MAGVAAQVKTIAALDTVIPLSPPLEDLTLPSEQKIVDTVKALMA